MAEERVERRLAAILAADVVGFSRLVRADEEATLAVVGALISDVIQPAIEDHRGRVFKKMGDAVLAEFGSSVDAVRCAIAVQQAIADRNVATEQEQRVAFRIGLHVGDVVVDGDDIQGDGVNVAARMEGLAAPDGICISQDVFRQVEGRVDAGFEDIGPQKLKNIPTPIRVYRIRSDGRQPGGVVTPMATRLRRLKWPMTGAAALVVALLVAKQFGVFPIREAPPDLGLSRSGTLALTLPDKPSIAVLPFENLSGSPEAEYFSDGITEDLITDLSKVSSLFVIARNSTFAYKGRSESVQQIARQLGVRYVLKGSVRRAGGKVRINAQLIDAKTGGNLWADRFDRDLEDIFAVQDAVTREIVGSLTVTLSPNEQRRLARRETSNLEAYDYALRGRNLSQRFERQSNEEARRLFEQAVKLDPNYALAYADLASTYSLEWTMGWSTERENLLRAADLAETAVRIDPGAARALAVLGFISLWRMDHDRALASVEAAVAAEPSHAESHLRRALILIWIGRPSDGVRAAMTAIRLNPNYAATAVGATYPMTVGHAHFSLRQFPQAIAVLKGAIGINRSFMPAHLILAATYAEAGQIDQARLEIAEIAKLSPRLTLAYAKRRLPHKHPKDRDRIVAALRKAEMTE